MKIKQIILIIVIIAAVAGAGVFAYMMFGKEAINPNVTAKNNTARIILPHGTKLDFAKVDKFNPTGKLFNYPVVDQATEIGQPLNDIIRQ